MDDVVQHVIHPEDQTSARAAASVARKATEDQGQGEFRLRDKQGGYIWVVTRTIIAERDLDLMPVRMVGTTIDISHLKEAQTRIRLAAEGSRLGFWEWLPQTDEVIFPDDSWPHLTGLPASRFPNMRESFELMHPHDRPVAEKAFAQVIDNEKDTVELHLRLRRDDDSYLSLLTRGQVTERDEHGRVLRMVGTSVDVTELKDAQRALEAARKFLRLVLDTVPESIFWKDTESRYQGGNRRFANDAGFERLEDVIGLSDDDMPWHATAIQLRAEDSALLSGHESVSQTEQLLDSTAEEQTWVSTTKVALPDEDGRAVGVLGVFRDITAYRQSLDDLQAERDRLELVIHGTGVGVWELDVATGDITVNERAAEILGYSRDELARFTAQSRLALVHPDDRATLKAVTSKSLEHGRGSYDVDYRIQHKQGRWLWLHDSGRVTARDADNEPLRMTGTIIDITERRERDGHLKTIAKAVTGAHGDGLLQTVVRAARDLTETGSAFVGALDDTGTKVSVIAAWPPDPSLDRFEYDLDVSPCANVLEDDICIYPQQVSDHFPRDKLLREMNIESYAGRRLTDDAGHPRGVFVLLDTKPFTQIERIRSVLDILSSTASNELERERRNSALRDSETRYRQTYERMPMLLCTIDQTNTVVDVNEAWSRAAGRSRHACLGHALDEFFTAQSNVILSAALVSNAAVIHSDGEHLILNSSDAEALTTEYTLFGAGHVSGTDYRILALEDVTAQLRAEEQLRIAATAFETHGAIAIADRERHILQINEAFTELTQYAQTEMVGCLPDVLKSDRHKDPFYQDIWYEVGQFGRWEGEMWGRRKDGSEFPMYQAITAVYDDARTVSHYVINMLDITERVRAEREIERLAFFDSLTGLANRRYLLDRLESAIAASRRRGTRGALLFIDLDRFKHINDSMGHAVGDEVLVQVAQRLQLLTRQEDVVCRLGGDEFVILLGEIGADATAAQVHTRMIVEKIGQVLSEIYVVDRQEFHITPTTGIAFFPDDANTPAEVLKRADSAMYQAKTEGRNTWRFYDPSMAAHATERMEMENDLRVALQADQFELHFQPQIHARHGVIGAEALIRWRHPGRGLVPPDKFIPIAEDSMLIHEIGTWVIEHAFAVAARWLDDGMTFIDHLAINLSSRQFRAVDFVAALERLRAAAGVPASFIVLELTEHTVIDDVEGTIAKMVELRELGFRFSVDDFGIGYSSLSYLRRLPLDQLKIDRSFVLDVVEDANAGVITETIIAMGRQLGLETIAEGVETEEQRDFLLARGCDEFQGYLYCRPLPDSEFREFCALHGAAVATP